MKNHKNNKIKQAFDSLEEIIKQIGPYMPKSPEKKQKEERQWKLTKEINFPPLKHNQVTSPF